MIHLEFSSVSAVLQCSPWRPPSFSLPTSLAYPKVFWPLSDIKIVQKASISNTSVSLVKRSSPLSLVHGLLATSGERILLVPLPPPPNSSQLQSWSGAGKADTKERSGVSLKRQWTLLFSQGCPVSSVMWVYMWVPSRVHWLVFGEALQGSPVYMKLGPG